MNQTQALKDSGLFTQVEPDWLVESQGYATWVNKSRGVVCKTSIEPTNGRMDCRVFFDTNKSTYHSSGWYDTIELLEWVFPVMRDAQLWQRFVDQNGDHDLTLLI